MLIACEDPVIGAVEFDELHVKRDALADEFEQALPLFYQLADLFIRMQACDSKIRKLIGQLGEDFGVDFRFAECGLVLFKAKAALGAASALSRSPRLSHARRGS